MEKFLDNIIPNINFKSFQDYILFLNYEHIATLITKDKNKVINEIIKTNNEIMVIEMRKNIQGFNDYKIICRKKSR
ncbi:MAG: hypothetical protein ACI4VQ_04935 [Clostridia bacterium]